MSCWKILRYFHQGRDFLHAAQVCSSLPAVRKWLSILCVLALALMPSVSRADEKPAPQKSGVEKVVVIPIHGPIVEPQLYVLRRGLKEAIDNGVRTVVLDMKTPGGSVDVTFRMLEALGKFPGKTITYVNDEAISAGALIAAGTDEIHFSPDGVIGAAAPVNSDGQDIGETMKAKVVSYLKARVRTVSEGKGYRSEVISAMIDADSEFKIGDQVIKGKDELLSLTAREAMKEYGDPPVPLLGAGIAKDLTALVDNLHGPGNWSMTRLEVTWSESFAQYLMTIAPVLMAVGMVCIFIEIKTPGFGIFGIAGGALLAAVFFGHFIAGLSGHEPVIFFALGVALIVVEIFFFPGSFAFAVTGAALMLGSLVWSMADLWPSEPLTFSADVFMRPVISTGIAVVLAIVIFAFILRFLPKGGRWGGMILTTAVGGEPGALAMTGRRDGAASLIGATGIAATAMYPTGQVLIAGRRYEAKVGVGFAEAGVPVKVTKQREFSLEVEVLS